jgi:hypothetical protein
MGGNSITDIMNSRISRAMLQEGMQYIMSKEINGVRTEEDVGRFMRSYRMGSGDGMTVHWEFNKDGKITTINDEMWGSVKGNELTYFRTK